jgi:myo-inositol-1(or 4)-monophosphatase
MTPDITAFFNAIQQRIGYDLLAEILALRNTPTEKADGSYVTEGDLLVERTVIAVAEAELAEVHLISEERELLDVPPTEQATVLVVDPIDGTENFTSGLPEWGVSIACYRNGVHVGSLLGAPELGIWLRTGDMVPRFTSRIRGLSSSLSREQIAALGVGPEYRMIGCCVVNMMAVVRGSYLSFENPKGPTAGTSLRASTWRWSTGCAWRWKGVPMPGNTWSPPGNTASRWSSREAENETDDAGIDRHQSSRMGRPEHRQCDLRDRQRPELG